MYKKILVPIDGSPTSKRGLAEAIRLAKYHKARVRLIHVVDVFIVTPIMGSDAEEVVRTSPVPVLLVRPKRSGH